MRDNVALLKDCVVTSAADDYENFELILKQTRDVMSARGMEVKSEEVAEALRIAINEGLVEAFVLSPQPPHSTKVEYGSDQLHELWYYATARGKQLAKGLDSL